MEKRRTSASSAGDGYVIPGPFTDNGFYAFDDRGMATSAISLMHWDDIYPDYFYPDPKHPIAHMHKRQTKTFPDQDVEFTSFSDNERFTIALVRGDTSPGRFYLVDLKAGSLVELLDTRWAARGL